MAEMWDRTREQYKMVERLLDPESDLCACMTDIEKNDLLNYMNLLAFKIRYPGITSGNKTITDEYLSLRQKRSGEIYSEIQRKRSVSDLSLRQKRSGEIYSE